MSRDQTEISQIQNEGPVIFQSPQNSKHRLTIMQRLKGSLGDTKLVVHILVCIFAISSWADLNGMWVELPLLVTSAPEQWTLPSYITIISQVANIGPIVFVVVGLLLPNTKPKLEKITSIVIIVIGIVAAVLLAFLWDKTSVLGGVEHSTALLVLNFFLAVGDCTSSVCYYAFMSLLKPEYMASLLFGEGLSGMLPAMIALGQGVGEINCVNVSSQVNETYPNGTEYNKTVYNVYPEYGSPSFSVGVFFIILSVILGCSAVAFLLLNFWSYCKSEMVNGNHKEIRGLIGTDKAECVGSYGSTEDLSSHVVRIDSRRNPFSSVSSVPDDRRSAVGQGGDNESMNSSGIYQRCLGSIPLPMFLLYQSILVVINMTFTSFLSSVQVYSTLPYGLQVYHLTTTLAQVANPMACFLAIFFMSKNAVVITTLTILGEGWVAYIIYLVAKSPDPPLIGESSGGALVIIAWILTTVLLVYSKVCVAGVMRQHGRTALICAGVSTQLGSFIGALVGFLLVNKYKVFKSAPYC